MNGLRAIELFAGYGGLALAVEDAFNAKTVAMAEVESAAIKVLGHRFPDAASLGDVTRIDWHRVNRLHGPIYVVGGGSPCQDLSPAGRQAGMRDGTRSGLWFSMLEGIRILRPSFVVWENVRGAYSAPADSDMEPCTWCVGGAGDAKPSMRALGRVLADLADLGYDAAWTGLRAADVGAPHGRFRIFVAAWPANSDGIGWGQDVTGVRTWQPDAQRIGGPSADTNGVGSVRGRSARGWRRGSADDGLAAAYSHGDGREVRRAGRPTTEIASAQVAGPGRTAADATGERRDEGRAESAGLVGGPDAPIGGDAPADTDSDGCQRRAECDERPTRGIAASQRLDTPGRFLDWGPYGPAIHRWEQALGRSAPSPTESGSKGQPRLAPAFVEFLMGLPAGWVTGIPGISRNDQLKMLGNGVVPQQAEAAISRLLTAMAVPA